MQLRLDVLGINDPLLDPSVPRLVDAARRYRRCDGVALFSADGGWRMAFASGETIAFLRDKDGSFVESAVVLSDGVLEQLAASSGVLADLFPPNARVA
jgi:hypothetical protein